MKLYFHGKVTGLTDGIQAIGEKYGFESGIDGIPVHIEQSEGDLCVLYDGTRATIRYSQKIHFFRALGILLEHLPSGAFEITEQPQFDLIGTSFDVSRNSVLRVESIKNLLTMMAVMGMNVFMLYMEDVYTIEDRPYFGYMRGRYTPEELRECDDYADRFGIEIVPAIQTLAHLNAALKWNAMKEVRDTEDILLVGHDRTYRFVEDMIRAASSPLRSKRIFIGMDEAHFIGLGRYLKLNGYRNRFEILNEHLARVVEITTKHGLKPIMASDMYFRLGSENGEYYDEDCVIPEAVMDEVPRGVQLLYWDYYHADEGFYAKYINLHKQFNRDLMFFGGIRTWTGFCTNYGVTFLNSEPALRACKKAGIKEVVLSSWKDNGAENNTFGALLGMQLYAEHAYASEPDREKLRRRFRFCAGADPDHFMNLTYLDDVPGTVAGNYDHDHNPCKYLLWQDVLLGLFDDNVKELDLAAHYRKWRVQYESYKFANPEWGFVFEVPEKLCAVLELKCDLGIRLKALYDEGNLEYLTRTHAEELPELLNRVKELRIAHRNQWFKTYKPFGWEVLDLRYGGLIARIESVQSRLADFTHGKIGKIEELEEQRLDFDEPDRPDHIPLAYCNLYNRIVSPGAMN